MKRKLITSLALCVVISTACAQTKRIGDYFESTRYSTASNTEVRSQGIRDGEWQEPFYPRAVWLAYRLAIGD